jgi:hypothetical protein
MANDRDLIIIAPNRATFRDVEEFLGDGDVGVEIRLDRRREQRRARTPAAEFAGENRRRRRERRKLDVSEPLQTTGWVLIPAEQRDE